jgi:hypothetical protein
VVAENPPAIPSANSRNHGSRDYVDNPKVKLATETREACILLLSQAQQA